MGNFNSLWYGLITPEKYVYILQYPKNKQERDAWLNILLHLLFQIK